MNKRLHLTVTASILAAAALSLRSLSALSASSLRNSSLRSREIAQVPEQPGSPDGSIVINYRKFSQPIP